MLYLAVGFGALALVPMWFGWPWTGLMLPFAVASAWLWYLWRKRLRVRSKSWYLPRKVPSRLYEWPNPYNKRRQRGRK